MDYVKGYLLSIFAACVCCAIIRCLVDDKSGTGVIIRVLCGVLLAIMAVSPIIKIRTVDWTGFMNDLSCDARLFTDEGAQISAHQLRTIITQRMQAYILEKASLYDCAVQADITLSDDPLPQPESVKISGAVSPYVRAKLSEQIETDLGIPKEMQQWTYQS